MPNAIENLLRRFVSGSWLGAIPQSRVLWGLSAYAVLMGLSPLVFHLTRVYPSNPWEAGITVEAARVMEGAAVYEPPSLGHATQMYGWMQPVLLAGVSQIIPLNNVTSRAISLTSALVLLLLLTRVLAGRQSVVWQVFAFASLFSANALSDFYFVAGRMDLLAILLGTCGLLVAYRAWQRDHRRLSTWFISGGLIILGVSFKQTAAFFSVIPLLAAWFCTPRKEIRWYHLFIPPLSVVAYLVAMRFCFPLVFEYMVARFTQYPVSPAIYLRTLWSLVRGACFMWPLLVWKLVLNDRPFSDPLRWVLVATVWLGLVTTIAFAKAGGSSNSLLPYYLGLACAGIMLLKELRDQLAQPASTKQHALILLLLVLWAAQWNPLGFTLNSSYFVTDRRQADYPAVISAARALTGTISCPEDPTVVFFATGRYSSNVYHERDYHGHWEKMPARVEADLASVDYVVDVIGWLGDDYINPKVLQKHGYQLHQAFATYAIWKRTSPEVE